MDHPWFTIELPTTTTTLLFASSFGGRSVVALVELGTYVLGLQQQGRSRSLASPTFKVSNWYTSTLFESQAFFSVLGLAVRS
jgi:hypothetical protein